MTQYTFLLDAPDAVEVTSRCGLSPVCGRQLRTNDGKAAS